MITLRKEPRFSNPIEFDNAKPSWAIVGHPKWSIHIKDLKLQCKIGSYPHEYNHPQDVLINLVCDYYAAAPESNSDISQVLCYDQLVQGIQAITEKDHIYFVENLAEMIADHCLKDARVQKATVKVERPDSLANAKSVGIEITRTRQEVLKGSSS